MTCSWTLMPYVTSHLAYCNMLYVGLPLKSIWNIQLVQNEAAQTIMGSCLLEPVMPLLCIVCQYAFRLWQECLSLVVSTCPVGSGRSCMLQVPSTSVIWQDPSFLVMASSLWNIILDIRLALILLTFCNALKARFYY